MKKIKVIALSALAFVTIGSTVFVSCQKQQELVSTTPKSKGIKNARLFQGEIPSETFILNPDDPKEQDVSFAIYNLTKAFVPLTSNPELMNALISKINSKPAKIYNLYDFANDNSIVENTLNTYFENLEGFPTNVNYRETINNFLNYDISYSPYFHIANQETYDQTKPVIIASATQINEELYPDLEDNIPCWKIENGNVQFLTIGEEDLKTITNPIIIIDNNIRDEENVPYTIQNDIHDEGLGEDETSGPSNSGTVTPEFLHPPVLAQSKFKIMMAHEKKWSRIDYTILAATSKSASNSCAASADRFKIRIKHNQVKKDITKYVEILNYSTCYVPNTTPAQHYSPYYLSLKQDAFVGTYEHDWYASYKSLGTISDYNASTCANQGNFQLKGKRQFHSDWYHFNPSTNDGYYILNNHPMFQTNTYLKSWNGSAYIELYNPY